MKGLTCSVAHGKALRFCGFLLAAIALVAPPAFAGVNRWTTSGPSEANVSSIAINPKDPETVYAATDREVFKSTDGGLSWASTLSSSPFTSSFRSSLAIDPSSSDTVYAAMNDGVFKSIDGGASWAAVGEPVSTAPAGTLAVDPAVPSNAYASFPEGRSGALLRSTDGGRSWSKVLSAEIYSLVFPAQTPSTIFAAGYLHISYYYYPSTLFKSTDAGVTWSGTSIPTDISPRALAIDPRNPSTLYAGTFRGGVHKSEDSGRSWSLTSSGLPPDIGVTALVIDPWNLPWNPRTLYAGTSGQGVFRSTNGGGTWNEFNTGLRHTRVNTLAIDRTGTRLYAGTSYGGVFAYQISSGPLDLSVGSDNSLHLLSADLDNRVGLQSFDNAGNWTSGAHHGPYSGWYATAVADGPDGLTRVLWNHLDGSASIWLVGPTGNLAYYLYGPVAGWTAVDVSVDRDDTTHILWTNTDGRASLWSLNLSGALFDFATFGPYPGWLARSISDRADGVTRLLWSNTDGRIGLSLVDAGTIAATYRFTPSPGWTARDVTVAADNRARILLAHADGRAALWTVDDAGAVRYGPVYAPTVAGQTATRISAGADGLTRVLWTNYVGYGTVWLLDLENIRPQPPPPPRPTPPPPPPPTPPPPPPPTPPCEDNPWCY